MATIYDDRRKRRPAEELVSAPAPAVPPPPPGSATPGAAGMAGLEGAQGLAATMTMQSAPAPAEPETGGATPGAPKGPGEAAAVPGVPPPPAPSAAMPAGSITAPPAPVAPTSGAAAPVTGATPTLTPLSTEGRDLDMSAPWGTSDRTIEEVMGQKHGQYTGADPAVLELNDEGRMFQAAVDAGLVPDSLEGLALLMDEFQKASGDRDPSLQSLIEQQGLFAYPGAPAPAAEPLGAVEEPAELARLLDDFETGGPTPGNAYRRLTGQPFMLGDEPTVPSEARPFYQYDWSAIESEPWNHAHIAAALDAGVPPEDLLLRLIEARQGTEAGQIGNLAEATALTILSHLEGRGGSWASDQAQRNRAHAMMLRAGIDPSEIFRSGGQRDPLSDNPDLVDWLRETGGEGDYHAWLRETGRAPQGAGPGEGPIGDPGGTPGTTPFGDPGGTPGTTPSTWELGYDALAKELEAFRNAEEQRILESGAFRGVLGGSPELADRYRLAADLTARHHRGLSDLAAQERGFGLQEQELDMRRQAMEADIDFRNRQLDLMRLGMDRDEAYRRAQFEWEQEKFGQMFGWEQDRFNRQFDEDRRRFDQGFDEDRRRYEDQFREDRRRYERDFGLQILRDLQALGVDIPPDMVDRILDDMGVDGIGGGPPELADLPSHQKRTVGGNREYFLDGKWRQVRQDPNDGRWFYIDIGTTGGIWNRRPRVTAHYLDGETRRII